MKKLIAVYSDSTEKYVDREVGVLEGAGIPVEKRNINTISAFFVRTAPCFVVEKYGKYGVRLTGKFNDSRVLDWASNINWE